MSNRSVALYNAVLGDVEGYLPFGPVGLGDIPPDASYKQFASSYLVSSVIRKWIPRESSKQDAAAKEKFLAANKSCMDWRLTLESEADRELWGSFLREMDDFWHPGGDLLVQSYYDLVGSGRTGPGAAIGARGESLYAKLFSSQHTVTSPLLNQMFRDYHEWFPPFSEGLCQAYEAVGFPRIVSGSRSSFVPKTDAISRMICVEPSLNIYLQLGLGEIISRRLKAYGIRLDSQWEVNQRLACQGSSDGSISTIDLESASDSISLGLCEACLPSWAFALLCELRSPWTEIGKSQVRLGMVSTMGNGFTFPLQTAIFMCIIRAAYRVSGTLPEAEVGNSWSVFGDDLICASGEISRYVLRLLSLCGFRINSSKTFLEGRFRESCGTDWLNGQPVRPVFIKKMDTKQDIFVAINALNEWSAKTGIFLPISIGLLLSWLKPEFRTQTVPFEENMDAGLRVPFSLSHRRGVDQNLSRLYVCDRPVALTVRADEWGIRTPRGVKELHLNPNGLWVSFLYGELVDGLIMVRHDRVRYRPKLGCSPRWDYMPNVRRPIGSRFTWQQWVTAVERNLQP